MGIVSKIYFIAGLLTWGIAYLIFTTKGASTAWVDDVYVIPALALPYVPITDWVILLLLAVGCIGIFGGPKNLLLWIIH